MMGTEKKLSVKGISTMVAVAIIVVIIIVAAVVSVWWIYLREEEGPSIKIGVIGPMQYPQGKHHKYGAELAVEEINEQGGVLGKKLKLVVVDSGEMEEVNTLPIEKMLSEHNISLIVGGFRTEAVLAMQDVAMNNKKIFLGCGASDDDLCQRVLDNYAKYKYWFRVTPTNSTSLWITDARGLGTFGAIIKGTLRQLGITDKPKVAILAEQADWADGIVAAAQYYIPLENPLLGGLNMSVVDTWRPLPTATDVDAELSAIEAAGAHIIFTALSGPVGITYAKRWGELEIPAASIGINVEAQKKGFWDATNGEGNYETTMNTYAWTNITKLTKPFLNKFNETYGEWPTYNAGTYDAIYLWAEAVTRAGTLDSDKVVEELENTGKVGGKQHFRDADEGVGTGNPKLMFNDAHDVVYGPSYALGLFTQWQNGTLECVWPMGIPASYPNLATASYTIPPWALEEWTS